MRVAIVEPYFGGSHRCWAEGYRDASAHEVELITHEARFWKWRMQGAFVTLAGRTRDLVRRDGPFDVIVASSMLDVAGFLGALGADRSHAAVALYMHENQLSYPHSPRDRADETHAMINWTSMVVADVVHFNSRFHHDVWFDDIARLLARFPDHRHDHLLDEVRARSDVLPVGVELSRFDPTPDGTADGYDPPIVLWNHRWEHDKGPDMLLAAVEALVEQHQTFRLIVTGEEPPADHRFRDDLTSILGDRLIHAGHVGDSRYVDLVRSADIVLSTARQEFFGVSITEAVYAGAFPVLPNRLVYPERLPARFHDRCLYDDLDGLVDRVAWAVDQPVEARAVGRALRPVMAEFDWSRLADAYDARLERLAHDGPRHNTRGGSDEQAG